MEFSLDSYDWVMINNVYSMGMFADGGLTTTKAYISGGNYIKNMSDITVGDWAKKWTILYYYFIYRNYALLDGRSTIYKSQWDKYEDKEMIKREGKRLMLGLTSS
jgi:deoxyribodipyrimidine photolyase-related protein